MGQVPCAMTPGQIGHLQVVQAPKISSKYRGLCWDKKHRAWRVRIFYMGKQRHVGRFKDDLTAARAYDKAALYLYGSKAILNFSIEECLADPTEVSGFIMIAKQQSNSCCLVPRAVTSVGQGPPGLSQASYNSTVQAASQAGHRAGSNHPVVGKIYTVDQQRQPFVQQQLYKDPAAVQSAWPAAYVPHAQPQGANWTFTAPQQQLPAVGSLTGPIAAPPSTAQLLTVPTVPHSSDVSLANSFGLPAQHLSHVSTGGLAHLPAQQLMPISSSTIDMTAQRLPAQQLISHVSTSTGGMTAQQPSTAAAIGGSSNTGAVIGCDGLSFGSGQFQLVTLNGQQVAVQTVDPQQQQHMMVVQHAAACVPAAAAVPATALQHQQRQEQPRALHHHQFLLLPLLPCLAHSSSSSLSCCSFHSL